MLQEQIFTEKTKSLAFLNYHILPCFGTQPKANLKHNINEKQPSFITKAGKVFPIAWKEYQQFYQIDKQKRKKLNSNWQQHSQCGVSSIFGNNGNIYINGLDIDRKCFETEEEFSGVVNSLFEKEPRLNQAHYFSTPSGGLRIIFGSTKPIDIYRMSLVKNGKHHGELLNNSSSGGHSLFPGCEGYQWINYPDPQDLVMIDDVSHFIYSLNSNKNKSMKTDRAWDKYIENFQYTSSKYVPLTVALLPEHRDIIEYGRAEGDRNTKGIALALDLVGAYEELTAQGQAVLETPEELFDLYCDNCNPPIDAAERNTILNSAYKHDGYKSYKSTLSPDFIKTNVAAYLWQHGDKQQFKNNKKSEKIIPIGNNDKYVPIHKLIAQDLKELIEEDIQGYKLKTRLTAIASNYHRSLREIEELYQISLKELEFEDEKEDTNRAIDGILETQNKDIDLEKYLPLHIVTPLNKLSLYLGVNKLVLLTNLLTFSASLIPIGTRLELYRATGFYAKPILYSGICAPSGSNKSGSINLFLKPLRELQRIENERYNEELKQYKRAVAEWKADKKKLQEPIEPNPPREYYVNDSTSEAIARIQNNQPNNGFLGYFDELAELLGQANKYRSGKGSDIQKLLSGRDGSGIKINRASGLRIDCPHSGYSIIGAIQPEVLKSMMGDFSDSNGFWARFIWATQEIKIRPNARNIEIIDIKPLLMDSYRFLNRINNTFTLSKAAADIYDNYFNYAENLKANESKPALQSIISKSQGVVGELALILHCVNAALNGIEPDQQVSGQTMANAVELYRDFYFKQILLIQAGGDEQDNQKLVYSKIINLSLKKGWIRAKDVKLNIRDYRNTNSSEIRDIFKKLVSLGRGRTKNKGTRLQWNIKLDGDGDKYPVVDPNSDKLRKVDTEDKRLSDNKNVSTVCESIDNKGIQDINNNIDNKTEDKRLSDNKSTQSIDNKGIQDINNRKVDKNNKLHQEKNNINTDELTLGKNNIRDENVSTVSSFDIKNASTQCAARNTEKEDTAKNHDNRLSTVSSFSKKQYQSYNPYDAVQIDEPNNRINIDESKIPIYRTKKLNLDPWTPSIEIGDYKDATKIYLDIETVGGLDPSNPKARVISIGLMKDVGDTQTYKLITHRSEKVILGRFLNLLQKTECDLIVGHNIHNFDIPFLHKRLTLHNFYSPFSTKYKTTRVSAASFNGKPLEIQEWNCHLNSKRIDLIDTFIQACVYDKSAAILPNYRLKDVAIALGYRDERRLELDHNQIAQLWADNKEESTAQIEEYLKYDLDDTKSLADYFIPVIWYQQQIVPMDSLQDLSVASPALKWQLILQSSDKYCRPKADPKRAYEGALTSCEPGLYKNCYKIDVSSMYPSIILSYEICSRKDIDKLMLRVMKYLVEHRFALKRKYKETKEAIYDQQQGSLKILLNSGYGFLGVGGYSYNDMGAAALITAYGRIILTKMCDVIRGNGGFVIETDTDGIICTGGNPQQVTEAVRDMLPDGIDIDLDFVNNDIYVPKRKSYLLFTSDKIKKVGLFRKRNRMNLENEFSVEFVKRYLNNPQEAIAYYQETAQSIIDRTIDLDSLKITQKIPVSSKALIEAGIGKAGDKVTYYWGEDKRYHVRTGKSIKSIKKPITEGEYWIEHYLDILNKSCTEIIKIITKQNPNFLINNYG